MILLVDSPAKNKPPKYRVNCIEYLNNNSHATSSEYTTQVWEHYYFLYGAGYVIRGWFEQGVELSAREERGVNAYYIYESSRARVYRLYSRAVEATQIKRESCP